MNDAPALNAETYAAMVLDEPVDVLAGGKPVPKTHSVLSLTKAQLGRLRFVLGEFGGLCEEVSVGIDAVEQASDDALLARIDKAIASFGP